MTTILIIGILIIIPSTLMIVIDSLKTRMSPEMIDKLAREVIAGEWGNGQERVNRLKDKGYDYTAIQARVNKILTGNSLKSIHSFPLSNTFLKGLFGIIISVLIVIGIPTYQLQKITKNAELACTINTNRNIYYDVTNDQYFITHINAWNIIDIYSVEYISKEDVENIIKASSIVDSWDHGYWE